jgi:hypothetical protein
MSSKDTNRNDIMVHEITKMKSVQTALGREWHKGMARIDSVSKILHRR